jgi:translation initiation factor 2B subunit (eIF-2B alpha/beta/delta family)/ADP-ribose pyrophosphatase YjhB (NUDIX family)
LDYHPVVTSFLISGKQILLLRRSEKVGTHRGLWSAVSGYLEDNEQPLRRALTEIHEELALDEGQVSLIRAGEVVRAYDYENNTVWVIHPFLFEAKSRAIQLDWENIECVWINPNELDSYPTVPKLKEVFDRVRDLQASPAVLSTSLKGVDDLSRDRIHGASFLGRQAVELLSTTCSISKAEDKDELFSELLLVAQKLRNAQPGMANVWNLVGIFLHLVDRERSKAISVSDLKTVSGALGEKIIQASKEAAEDASRNTAHEFPERGRVLTHSYSSAVLRSLELGVKSGKGVEVYATESYPGMEGIQLAQDLIKLGIPVKSIADSTVDSVIPTVDLVLVGSDSVLSDGALVHKIGTKHIAAVTHSAGVLFRSTCETMKFSVQDFLGERPKITEDVFDLTPGEYVSGFTTEFGKVEPCRVGDRIKSMVEHVYP